MRARIYARLNLVEFQNLSQSKPEKPLLLVYVAAWCERMETHTHKSEWTMAVSQTFLTLGPSTSWQYFKHIKHGHQSAWFTGFCWARAGEGFAVVSMTKLSDPSWSTVRKRPPPNNTTKSTSLPQLTHHEPQANCDSLRIPNDGYSCPCYC